MDTLALIIRKSIRQIMGNQLNYSQFESLLPTLWAEDYVCGKYEVGPSVGPFSVEFVLLVS